MKRIILIALLGRVLFYDINLPQCFKLTTYVVESVALDLCVSKFI
jgi:hypothetical protein